MDFEWILALRMGLMCIEKWGRAINSTISQLNGFPEGSQALTTTAKPNHASNLSNHFFAAFVHLLSHRLKQSILSNDLNGFESTSKKAIFKW